MNFPVLDNACARVERVLNKIGWVPFASWVSGIARLIIGKIMIIVSLVMAAYKFMRWIITNDPLAAEEAHQYAGYVFHGIANIVRGLIEIVPFVNMICLLYDAFIGRFSYTYETMERGVRPLNPYHRQFEVVQL